MVGGMGKMLVVNFQPDVTCGRLDATQFAAHPY